MLKYKQFEIGFQQSGLIKNIVVDKVYLNLFELSNIDQPINNIYIKFAGESFCLLNAKNNLTVNVFENEIEYKGEVKNIQFVVSYKLSESNTVFVDVKTSEKVDIYYATDVSLLDAVGGNAAYASQYIDNKVFANKTVAMRKTTKNGLGYSYGQFGSLNQINSYVTEGYDFYGLGFKLNNQIEGLQTDELKSRPRNYELGFVSLQVANESSATFYNYFEQNHEQAIGEMHSEVEIKKAYAEFSRGAFISSNEVVSTEVGILNGEPISLDQLQAMYPQMQSVEKIDNEVASFFTENHAHIVLPLKELKTERTHANIITTGNHSTNNDKTFVSSNYMNGVFAAQNTVGNTQINCLNNNVMSSLYLSKLEGMRILVKSDESYSLLNVPSVYELGFNYSSWLYKLPDNEIEIHAFTTTDNPQLTVEFKAQKPVSLLVTDAISNNFNRVGNKYIVKENTFQAQKNPELQYEYKLEGGQFVDSKLDQSISAIEFNNQTTGAITIAGSKTSNIEIKPKQFKTAKLEYQQYFNQLLGNFHMQIDNGERENINNLNHLVYWYVHNALIHFATPHGVEQHGGAAWGTRDVCQGPVELFATLKRFDVVRDIIIKVFDNQFIEDGNWPQWFMFDEYDNVRANESHGDIIVWPIKALADYLKQTGDISILDEICGYYTKDNERSKTEQTLLEHLNKAIEYIENNFLEGTFISSYGEGDWDDTLQPANTKLRKYMASGWTVPLTYQAFSELAKATSTTHPQLSEKLDVLSAGIKKDYNKILIKDGIITGFIYREDPENCEYLLHPTDQKTGIKYRLLPINRSIISGLFTEEQIQTHLQVIDEHLKCPDGIRLMDAPANYQGGISEIFQRAETASTVGREISLQYVHAHIRYIEAMTKIGNSKRAYEAIKVINPINIQANVPNANIRQSNAYYSSSEGDFNNRYDYKENFNKLKTGDITVKSGWRIYSSGPGIFLKQFIENFLGFKTNNNQLLIDSVVGNELDGLQITQVIDDKNVTIKYSIACSTLLVNDQQVAVSEYADTYKKGGFIIKSSVIADGDVITVPIRM